MSKTLRVHNLAKELGVESKEIVAKCAAEGIELKNHMAVISLGLAESIREWFSAGEDVTTVEVAAPVDLAKVRKPTRRKSATAHGAHETATSHIDDESHSTVAAESGNDDSRESSIVEVDVAVMDRPQPAIEEIYRTPEPVSAPELQEVLQPAARAPELVEHEHTAEADLTPNSPAAPPPASPVEGRILKGERPASPVGGRIALPPKPEAPKKPADVVRPAGPQHVPKPAELKGPRVVRIEAPEVLSPPRQRPRPAGPGTGPGPAAPGGAGTRSPIALPPSPVVGGRRKKGRVEDEEAAERRARERAETKVEEDIEGKIREWRDQDLLERQERLRSATGHGLAARRAAERRRQLQPGHKGAGEKRGPTPIEAPISMREFCSTVGVPFAQLLKRLMEHSDRMWSINEQLDAETIVLLATDFGLELEVTKARTELEKLVDEVASRERENLKPRPPIVTILGHVDHGKTSLLDRIRETKVAAGEAGGITQHIGAYRVDKGDWHVTFLDTPGHAAFTAMRARGAHVTDVVVLVVAANDGVQPQTIEAINHAKAAGVEIVIALNKIDLPGVDINKVYGQLAEHELVPTEWGGNTDVVKTSATTGQGVDDLLGHLSQLSELMQLNADASIPAVGTVLEARMREGQGGAATLLVREGTLRIGQHFVCGPSSGRVRQLRDDRGRALKEAGPGTPVEITGLDALPRSGDMLYVLDDLDRAKIIARQVQDERRQEGLQTVQSRKSTLEDLLKGAGEEVLPELNMILKADVQGSVDALRLELGKLPSDKVKLVIKHAGVGAINEADVDLARVSNAIIVGFHIVADDHARRHADELGVEIRLYRVIYEIIADVEKALAGLLAPLQQEQRHGTVEVRKVFNVSKLGTIAGCYVRDGSVARNHRVRLVRDGRIILENGELDSLKRFKDDSREVKAGLECGIKIAGFDDIKPGDEIQSYTFIQVAQKL